MEELATRLTVDIIGKVVLDSDFNAQRSENPIVNTFRKQITLMPPTGINPFANLNPLRHIKVIFNGRKLDRLIGEELDRKFSASKTSSNGSASGKAAARKDRKRSVVDLALEAYQKESTSSTSRTGIMDAAFRRNSIDSIKTFIFAGHDTTSSTIAYVFYLLHLYPDEHAKVTAELREVFGDDISAETIAAQIRANPYLVNKLEYTTAVIKETLRLFPPASTLRDVGSNPQNLALTDPDTGEIYPLAGFTIWPVVHLIHRNEDYVRPPSPLPFKFFANFHSSLRQHPSSPRASFPA